MVHIFWGKFEFAGITPNKLGGYKLWDDSYWGGNLKEEKVIGGINALRLSYWYIIRLV